MGERGRLAFCQNRGIKSCFEEYPYTVFNARHHIFANSKNVTPRRMLKKCFLTAQMNTVRSIAFRICKTKNPKNTENNGQLFGCVDFGECWRPNW